MGRTLLGLISLLVMTLGLPLLGVIVWGKDASHYLQFPPRTIHLTPAPFSRAAFAL